VQIHPNIVMLAKDVVQIHDTMVKCTVDSLHK
jgi:hypothetical protein